MAVPLAGERAVEALRLQGEPVLLDADAFDLASSSSESSASHLLTDAMKSAGLWYWRKVTWDVPPPMWALPSTPIELDAPSVAPDAAWSSGGQLLVRPPPLTGEQRREARLHGTVTVPCEAMPAQPHVWRLNRLLGKGWYPTLFSLRRDLGLALSWVVMDIPGFLYSNHTMSVRACAVKYARVARDVIDLFIGVSVMKPDYDASEISAHMEQACARWIMLQAVREPPSDVTGKYATAIEAALPWVRYALPAEPGAQRGTQPLITCIDARLNEPAIMMAVGERARQILAACIETWNANLVTSQAAALEALIARAQTSADTPLPVGYDSWDDVRADPPDSILADIMRSLGAALRTDFVRALREDPTLALITVTCAAPSVTSCAPQDSLDDEEQPGVTWPPHGVAAGTIYGRAERGMGVMLADAYALADVDAAVAAEDAALRDKVESDARAAALHANSFLATQRRWVDARVAAAAASSPNLSRASSTTRMLARLATFGDASWARAAAVLRSYRAYFESDSQLGPAEYVRLASKRHPAVTDTIHVRRADPSSWTIAVGVSPASGPSDQSVLNAALYANSLTTDPSAPWIRCHDGHFEPRIVRIRDATLLPPPPPHHVMTYSSTAAAHARWTVTSRYPLWRFARLGMLYAAMVTNALISLLVGIVWCSPLGVRALFLSSETFNARKKYRQPTRPARGEKGKQHHEAEVDGSMELSQRSSSLDGNHDVERGIAPSLSSSSTSFLPVVLLVPSHPTLTFVGRLRRLAARISLARAVFEAAPDTGILGKGITRLFHLFWWYICIGFVGFTSLILLFPLLSLFTILLSIFLAVASPVWALAVTLFVYVSDIFFLATTDEAKTRTFPLLVTFSRAILYLSGIIFCLLAPFIFILPLSLFYSFFALGRFVVRVVYDHFIFFLLLRPLGRQPHRDTFLARRIAGPSLSSSVYRQISSSMALALLHLRIEVLSLTHWRSYATALLSSPNRKFTSFMSAVLSPLVGTNQTPLLQLPPHLVSDASKASEAIDNAIDEQARVLNALVATTDRAPLTSMRLSRSDLSAVLHVVTKMLKEMIEARIIPLLLLQSRASRDDHVGDEHVIKPASDAQLASLWMSTWNLPPGSYEALARRLVGEVSQDLMTPIEAIEQSFVMKVNHVSLPAYAEMIATGNARADLDEAVVVQQKEGMGRALLGRIDVKGPADEEATQLAMIIQQAVSVMVTKEGKGE